MKDVYEIGEELDMGMGVEVDVGRAGRVGRGAVVISVDLCCFLSSIV